MASRSRAISKLLGSDNKIQETSFSESVSLGTESIPTVNDLPLSGNQVGDFAFVEESNRLYIWSGSGWYSVALINTSPAFDSGGSPEAAYDLDSIGGTATTITLSATDPEGVPITYSAIPSDSANDLATITQTDNVFVVTSRSRDSIIANGYDPWGEFNVTFRASDGINLATALSEFTLPFVAPPEATGGTIVDSDISGVSYRIHSFTTVGNSTFTVTKGGNFEVLIVGGGCGGAYNNLDGVAGSGGGVVIDTVALETGAYTITVGAGGTGKAKSVYGSGTNGGSSSAFGLTAGGGRATALNSTVSGTPQSNSSAFGAGGGAGGSPTSSVGGPGLASNITGQVYLYGAGGGYRDNLGGASGGGDGAGSGGVLNAEPNSGGGGGGGSHQLYVSAGNGGSGVVIIRYITG